jgi:hypothetical protein
MDMSPSYIAGVQTRWVWRKNPDRHTRRRKNANGSASRR